MFVAAILFSTLALTANVAFVSLHLPSVNSLRLPPLPIFMQQREIQLFAQHAKVHKYIFLAFVFSYSLND